MMHVLIGGGLFFVGFMVGFGLWLFPNDAGQQTFFRRPWR